MTCLNGPMTPKYTVKKVFVIICDEVIHPSHLFRFTNNLSNKSFSLQGVLEVGRLVNSFLHLDPMYPQDT